MTPSTNGRMFAVTIPRPGPPDVLRWSALTIPTPERRQLRIRVTAAAVNPTDTMLRQHGPRTGPWPRQCIPGMDLVGVIDAVGPEVRQWTTGQRVMAAVNPQSEHGGAQAQYVVVEAAAVAAVPPGIDDVDAATLPMNGLTALLALKALDLPRGATLAVTGAAGTFGGYVIQLAKFQGLRVIAQAAARDVPLVARLGADVVVPRTEYATAQFRAVLPEGAAGCVDAAVLDSGALGIVGDNGQLATVRFWDGPAERGISIHPVKVADSLPWGDGLSELATLADRGVLSLRVADVLPAMRVQEAHRRLEAGGLRGRLVLSF